MERLVTDMYTFKGKVEDCENDYIIAVQEKLRHYEDSAEQGRLKEYKFIGNEVAIVIDCWEWQRTCTRMLSDLGKTVFLTKEEAEQALEQMKAGAV